MPILHKRGKLLVVILVSLLLAACSPRGGSNNGVPTERTEFLMDTVVTIKVHDQGPQVEGAIAAAFAEMKRVEELMSVHLPNSEVSQLNAAAGTATPVAVSPETFQVIVTGLEYAELTKGAFDISIGPILDLWQITGGTEYVPERIERERVSRLVDYSLVVIDKEQETVYLPNEEMKLDLGGVAKGYAVDRGLHALAQDGIESASIFAGGDVGVLGQRPDGRDFRIGIQNPRNTQQFVAVIPLADGSIVSSGDYQRFFMKDGVRYHHIFDPNTGLPAWEGVISATIVGPSAMEGDILSTAIFVLGVEEGLALIEKLEGYEALVVTENLEVFKSSGLVVTD